MFTPRSDGRGRNPHHRRPGAVSSTQSGFGRTQNGRRHESRDRIRVYKPDENAATAVKPRPRPTREHHNPDSPVSGNLHGGAYRNLKKGAHRHGGGHESSEKKHGATPHPHVNHVKVPPLTKGIRIIPLGGVEEVGRNMCAVETPTDLFAIDAGFQFTSEDDTPGVDYILPNIKYLEEHKDRVRALLVTHAHLDHIGGIPFIMPRIGNPPIYTMNLTALMIKKRQDEFPHLPPLDIKIVEPNQRFKIGETWVRTFPITHSIPDAIGFAIESEFGNVLLSGDMKLNHMDGVPTETERKNFEELGKQNNLVFFADSTNAERDGFSVPEEKVHLTIADIIKNARGRVIIGTFASQFARMIRIVEAAELLGKKIVTEGRSIRNNIEIAERAGFFKPKKGTFIPVQEMENYPSDKIIILATGAQGEEFAAMMRIASGKHKFIKLNERDTVVLSSSVIPGNEIAVQKLKDNLYRFGLKVIHYRNTENVHSTGHGNTGELTWITNTIKPRFFMPAYGYYSFLCAHAQALAATGFPKDKIIIPDNGMVIDFTGPDSYEIRKEKAPSDLMMVDGFAIGEVQEVVIRDRQTLAQDGMFVVIAMVSAKTGKLKKSPDIISRGFIYLRESQELLAQARLIVKKSIEGNTSGMNPINFEYIKKDITDALGAFLLQKTNKHPIVIPVILGV